MRRIEPIGTVLAFALMMMMTTPTWSQVVVDMPPPPKADPGAVDPAAAEEGIVGLAGYLDRASPFALTPGPYAHLHPHLRAALLRQEAFYAHRYPFGFFSGTHFGFPGFGFIHIGHHRHRHRHHHHNHFGHGFPKGDGFSGNVRFHGSGFTFGAQF